MLNSPLQYLKIKIFADGADPTIMHQLSKKPYIKGFTTNPTLMRQAGVLTYEGFAKEVVRSISTHPVCFEVFADDLDEMGDQAEVLARLGNNVYIKIPVTNTRGQCTGRLIHRLSQQGIKLNITAITTLEQVKKVVSSFVDDTPGMISVFAGRIADRGIDPEPHMQQALKILAEKPKLELLWASPRELFNIIQADRIGCHIITVTYKMLNNLPLLGQDLSACSLETVQMFAKDAQAANYKITTPVSIC